MDEAFRPLSAMVAEMTSFRQVITDEAAGVRLYVTKYDIDCAVELNMSRDVGGVLRLGSSPPLYPLMTSYSPVAHRLRFVASLDAGGDDG